MRLTRHGAAIISVFGFGGAAMLGFGIAMAKGESTMAGTVLIVMGALWLIGSALAIGDRAGRRGTLAPR